ncbi:DUF6185 family protein [Streptomyces sp. AN091965]|uniref:DUF6185 family protein n=1 Tax=Streptomyces sp. AN091965 TaxID=2927803 RepID=UPI001F60D6A7|nr:DUF6185 family protein [Streptomyces sp. AN091965]MCI3928003.1 DUF6185 family protein [Streptomyces sp. AN091965]
MRGLFTVLLAGLLTGSGVAEAYAVVASATADGSCDTRGLKPATVEARLRIDHDHRTYAKASATMKLTVPMSWKPAAHLLLSTGSDTYRRAMRCLARGDHDGVETRWEEWRNNDPAVAPANDPSGEGSSRQRWLEVRLSTHAWVNQRGTVRVGLWTVEVSKARWDVRLASPDTLREARWREVTVRPGRPGARSAEPRPTTKKDDGALVWRPTRAHGPPPVVVGIEPAWPRSFSALDNSPPYAVYSAVGGLLWQIAVVVAVWYALIVLPRHGVPDPVEARAVANLRNWSLTLLGVALTVQGRDVYLAAVGAFENTLDWAQPAAYAPSAWLTSSVAGALLLCFARPSRAVALLGAGLGACAAVPLVPGAVGLDPEQFVQPPAPGDATVAVVWAATVCSFVLPLLGAALAARRLAVDSGLWRPRQQRARAWPLTAGVGAVVAIVGVCYAAAAERDWNRASWLSPRIHPTSLVTDESGALSWEWGYGAWHEAELRSNLLWFTDNAQWWWYGMLWLLSGLAILAVLRSRAVRGARATALARRGPSAVDRFLLLLLFPVAAAMDIGMYTASLAVAWSWFFLYFLALAGILRLTRRRAVPARPLSVSGEPLATTLSAAHRDRLLERARRHRELHAELRGAAQEQTAQGTAARRDVETRLRRLHRWRASSGRPDRLPRDVSVVDAALALGPCDSWWENGVRAARFTQPVALPFSAILVWDNQLRGEALTSILYDRLGLPDVPTQFVLWQVGYAAAGFLLGALWQQLPGRRGPAKALALAAAYTGPIGVFALGNWGLGEEQTALAFAAVSMLLILTLTGVRMDVETFRGDLLPGRGVLSLLPAVYQTRYLSLQFAWVLAQAAAIATIVQFFADNAGPPWVLPGVSP